MHLRISLNGVQAALRPDQSRKPWRLLPGIENFNGGRGSRNQLGALGVVESDSDRNTLGQPHPIEGRIYIGKKRRAGTTIAVFDTGCDTFHSPLQYMFAAQQPHVDRIAEMDTRQL